MYVNQALRAVRCLNKDVHYLVRDERVSAQPVGRLDLGCACAQSSWQGVGLATAGSVEVHGCRAGCFSHQRSLQRTIEWSYAPPYRHC